MNVQENASELLKAHLLEKVITILAEIMMQELAS